MCRLFFHALIVLAAFNAVPVSKAAARPDATEKPTFLWIVTEDIGCDMGCYGDNCPWEKPSAAFFHLANTQKRQGFPGVPIAASCGGRPFPQSAKGVYTPNLNQLAAEGILPGLSPSLPSTRSCSESLPTPNHSERLSCIHAPL